MMEKKKACGPLFLETHKQHLNNVMGLT